MPQGPEKLEFIFFKCFGIKFSQIKSIEFQTKNVEEIVGLDENGVENECEDVDTVDSKMQTQDGPDVDYAYIPTQRKSVDKLTSNRRAVQSLIGENYLDAVLSAGKLERWNPRSFPLKVYIQTGGVPIEFVHEIRNAFSTWENSTKGFVKFIYVNSPESADYKCLFSNLKNRNCDEKGFGTAGYQYFEYDKSGNIKDSVVEFAAYDCNGNKWRSVDFYNVALHEIGHGLGLRGHSGEDTDLMYPVAVGSGIKRKISESDMTTLRAVYSIIPDVTNLSFTDKDKEGLISSEEFWGDSSQRAEFIIPQILENIALTPDNPSLYIELGRAYRDKKDNQMAVDAYSKALKLVDNSQSAVAVLQEVAVFYIEIGQYESAIKCLNRMTKYGNNNVAAELYNYIAVEYAYKKQYNLAALNFDKALNLTSDLEFKKKIYQNFCWLALQQGDRLMFEKYQKLHRSL